MYTTVKAILESKDFFGIFGNYLCTYNLMNLWICIYVGIYSINT